MSNSPVSATVCRSFFCLRFDVIVVRIGVRVGAINRSTNSQLYTGSVLISADLVFELTSGIHVILIHGVSG